jgi:hypothetical protein
MAGSLKAYSTILEAGVRFLDISTCQSSSKKILMHVLYLFFMFTDHQESSRMPASTDDASAAFPGLHPF